MKSYTEDDVLSSFLAVLCYAHQYFNTSNINPIEFWSKILSLASCRLTHFVENHCIDNASLEILFSKTNLIKTILRNRLTNDSLSS